MTQLLTGESSEFAPSWGAKLESHWSPRMPKDEQGCKYFIAHCGCCLVTRGQGTQTDSHLSLIHNHSPTFLPICYRLWGSSWASVRLIFVIHTEEEKPDFVILLISLGISRQNKNGLSLPSQRLLSLLSSWYSHGNPLGGREGTVCHRKAIFRFRTRCFDKSVEG